MLVPRQDAFVAFGGCPDNGSLSIFLPTSTFLVQVVAGWQIQSLQFLLRQLNDCVELRKALSRNFLQNGSKVNLEFMHPPKTFCDSRGTRYLE